MQLLISFPSFPLRGPAVPLRQPRRLAISAVGATGPTTATSTMYELLSVPETAGTQEIKVAYRRQARRWHPDTCLALSDKGIYAQQFMNARAAYELLSNPVLREDYDLALHAGAVACAERSGARPRRGGGDWGSQMEELGRQRSAAAPATWGSRMRSADDRSGTPD